MQRTCGERHGTRNPPVGASAAAVRRLPWHGLSHTTQPETRRSLSARSSSRPAEPRSRAAARDAARRRGLELDRPRCGRAAARAPRGPAACDGRSGVVAEVLGSGCARRRSRAYRCGEVHARAAPAGTVAAHSSTSSSEPTCEALPVSSARTSDGPPSASAAR